jgi:phosphoglycolate phosphatase
MPQLKGLIFDLDGTLLDSAPDLRQALNLTLAAHGRRPLTLEEATRLTGDGMLPMLSRAFAMTGKPIPDSESYIRFQEFITHYRKQKADPSQIYPHVIDSLKHFKKRGVAMGVCTNKQEASTIRLLEDLNIQNYFGFVAGGDTFPVHKPHPDHVRGVMQALKLSPANCVMVGDGSNDVRAAQGAGIPCILVTQGYGIDVEDLGAEAIIASFAELPTALQKLGFAI